MILTFPNPILQNPADACVFSDDSNFQEIANTLTTEVLKANCQSLTANQIGINAKMFVIGNTPDNVAVFINPIIVAVSESKNISLETCASFPHICVKIKRPAAIKVKWQTITGSWEEGEFSNHACKLFLQCFDLLEGITIRDRVSQLVWALAVKKSKKGL